MNLAQYKKNFYRDNKIHLNNAGLSLISRPAQEKIKYWADRFYQDGFYSDADYQADVSQSRKNLSRLLACSPEEIAFFQSTAGAVSQIAFGFALKPGDEVVLWEQEYSSNLYPWQDACKRTGAKLVIVPSEPNLATPTEKILKACSRKTKIVAVSWVQYQTGARTNLEELSHECHKLGIFVFADIIQGLGLHPFDFAKSGIDAAAGGSHKWLNAPVGVGYLALAKKHLDRFLPLQTGSSTYGTCDDPAQIECIAKHDASKFEAGSKQVLEITALGASIDLLLQTGVPTIEKEALRLAQKLRFGLEELGAKVQSPYPAEQHITSLVNFTVKDMAKLQSVLRAHPISFAMRGPGLRLSVSAYNEDADIERVLKLIKTCT